MRGIFKELVKLLIQINNSFILHWKLHPHSNFNDSSTRRKKNDSFVVTGNLKLIQFIYVFWLQRRLSRYISSSKIKYIKQNSEKGGCKHNFKEKRNNKVSIKKKVSSYTFLSGDNLYRVTVAFGFHCIPLKDWHTLY